MACRDNNGWGKAGQTWGQSWGDAQIFTQIWIWQIIGHEPCHDIGRQRIGIGAGLHGPFGFEDRGGGINQKL